MINEWSKIERNERVIHEFNVKEAQIKPCFPSTVWLAEYLQMLCMTDDAVLFCAPTVTKLNSQMLKSLFQNHQINLKTYRLLFLSLTSCFCTEGCSMPWGVSYILHPNVINSFWLLNNLCQFLSGNWWNSSCFSQLSLMELIISLWFATSTKKLLQLWHKFVLIKEPNTIRPVFT